jgi:hypothetical protein
MPSEEHREAALAKFMCIEETGTGWKSENVASITFVIATDIIRAASFKLHACRSLASHRGGPGSIPGLVKWDLWWIKWRWDGFSPSTSVSPANLHSTKFTIIITRGRYNRPISGRRAEWTQLDSTLHYANLKEGKVPVLN